MKSEAEDLPEEREVVLATVRRITPHGAYVTLDEYGEMGGFLHVSEISTGWVRNIERYVRLGQKIVAKVIRVSTTRAEVDLSLRLVTGEERKEKLIGVKKAEKAQAILEIVEGRLNMSREVTEEYRALLEEEFGSLYSSVEEVVKKGGKVLQKVPLPPEYVSTLEEVAKERVVIPGVEIHGIMEVKSNLSDGVEVIRSALTEAEKMKVGGAKIKISYLSAPKYRISVEAENYKMAEKALKATIEKIEDAIKKGRGSFSFIREHR